MAVADLQSWADELETIRLPGIEADISTLETWRLTADAERTQLSQQITDGLAAHSVRIDAAQGDADQAQSSANTAITTIHQTGLDANVYTDQQIQLLRDEFVGNLGTTQAAIEASNEAYVDQELAADLAAFQAEVAAAQASADAAAARVEQAWTDYETVSTQILDVEIPALRVDITAVQGDVATTTTQVTNLLAGYDYNTFKEGLDALEARAEQNIAPLGLSVPRLPDSGWTAQSSSAVFAKTPAPEAWFTTDPDLGDCAELTVGANTTLGQSYPVSFDPDAVYLVRIVTEAVSDGLSGGVRLHVGASTWNGATLAEANIQKELHAALPIASGPQTYEVYISANLSKLQARGLTVGAGVGDDGLHLTNSQAANSAFFHVRQNGGALTDGQARIALLEIKDVTEALDAAEFHALALKAEIEDPNGSSVGADLAQNYYTIADTDNEITLAVSALETELSAHVTALGGDIQDFSNGARFHTPTEAGLNPAPHSDDDVVSVTGVGKVLQLTGANQVNILTPQPGTEGKSWYIEAKLRVTVNSTQTGANRETAALRIALLDETGTVTGYDTLTLEGSQIETITPLRSGTGWVILSGSYTLPAGIPYFRPQLYYGYGDTAPDGDGTWQVAYLGCQDKSLVEDLSAEIYSLFYTQIEADAAIALAVTDMKAEIEDPDGDSIGATLNQSYWTTVDTELAMANLSTALSAQFSGPIIPAKGTFADQTLGDDISGEWTSTGVISVVAEANNPFGRSHVLRTTGRGNNFGDLIEGNLENRTIRVKGAVRTFDSTVPARVGLHYKDVANIDAWATTQVAVAGTAWTEFEVDVLVPGKTQSYRPYLQNAGTDGVDTMQSEWTDLEWRDISDKVSVEATLETDYYTIAAADGAIAGEITTLRAAIEDPAGDSVGADLAQNYLTEVDTTSAIAALETKLTAEFAGVIVPTKGTFDDQDLGDWTGGGVSVVAAPSTAWNRTWVLRSTGRHARYGDYLNGNVNGRVFRVRGQVTAFDSTVPAEIGIEYIKAADGTTGRVATEVRTAGQGRIDFDVEVTVPEATSSYRAYIRNVGVDGTDVMDSKWSDLSWVDVTNDASTRATLSTDYYTSANTDAAIAAEITALETRIEDPDGDSVGATVEDILATDVNALTGTAMAAMLTDLGVDANGNTATVNQHTSAISDIEGNMAAGVMFKVQAGNEVSLLELYAADDMTTGQGYTIAKLSADTIILDGTVAANHLVITDGTGNLVVNGDFAFGDLRGWDTAPAAAANVGIKAKTEAGAVSSAAPSAYMMHLQASDNDIFLFGEGSFSATPDDEFTVSWHAASSNDGSARVGIHLVWYDENGGVTGGAWTVYDETGTWVPRSYTASPPANTVYGKYRVRRDALVSGTESTGAYLALIDVRKKASAETVLLPNSVHTGLLDTVDLNVQQLAVFGGWLASSNYDAGVDGWKIDEDGNAEFNMVHVREGNIFDNAVSDLITAVTPHQKEVLGTGSSWTKIQAGSIVAAGVPVQVDFFCILENLSTAYDTWTTYFVLERSVNGGTWERVVGDWTSLFDAQTGGTNWEGMSAGAGKVSVQFRVIDEISTTDTVDYQVRAQNSAAHGTGVTGSTDIFVRQRVLTLMHGKK